MKLTYGHSSIDDKSFLSKGRTSFPLHSRFLLLDSFCQKLGFEVCLLISIGCLCSYNTVFKTALGHQKGFAVDFVISSDQKLCRICHQIKFRATLLIRSSKQFKP